MIFRNDIKQFALNLNDSSIEEVRFHLVCSTTNEVKKHFKATFAKIKSLKAESYSMEAIQPYRESLVEVLIELRVRGFESDAAGNVYKPEVFVPVPDVYQAARQRQMVRLRNLREEQLVSLCNSTIKTAMMNAGRSSKTALSSLMQPASY